MLSVFDIKGHNGIFSFYFNSPHLGDIQTSVTNNIFEFIGNVNS
ncbi:hypothetical protein FORC066_0608 [Yersinia enterocolitica]|nr:hypothetical protein FORC066_0608 [Yersinia enterocolitica]